MRILAWPGRRNAARNPYQALLCEALEAQAGLRVDEFTPRALLFGRGIDLLHLHWPDVFVANAAPGTARLRLAALRLLLAVAWLRGIHVVWTVHNLRRPGQRHAGLLERRFWPWLPGALAGAIHLSEASRQVAVAALPGLARLPAAVVPHGHYRPVLPPLPPRPGAAAVPTILFFGSLTAYKNAGALLAAFAAMGDAACRLRVLGKVSRVSPDRAFLDRLRRLSPGLAARVHFEDRFLPGDELAREVAAADLAVLPYREVLNSGAAIYALSAGTPVLGPDCAPFRELRAQVGGGWVGLFDDPLTGAGLARALAAARGLKAGGAPPDLAALDWEGIALRTAAFFRRLAAEARHG